MAEIDINDQVFHELKKRGYSEEGKKKIWNVAHSKLWYMEPYQAEAFLKIEGTKKYNERMIQMEIDLINKEMDTIIKEFQDGHLNIIDLGCGDGKKATLFIKKLNGKVKLRYCPIDISNYMVEKALKNIRELELSERVKLQWNISDFDNLESIATLLRFKDYQRNFFLLLGNTLGEFEINDLLFRIRRAMKEEDVLLICNGLDNNNTENMLKTYKSDEVNNFLKLIPLQMGLKDEEIEYGVRFQNHRVEMFYTINVDKKIEYHKEKIEFKKGDQIIVGISYKYPKKDFISFLKMYFDNVQVKVSNDESHALALCKK